MVLLVVSVDLDMERFGRQPDPGGRFGSNLVFRRVLDTANP